MINSIVKIEKVYAYIKLYKNHIDPYMGVRLYRQMFHEYWRIDRRKRAIVKRYHKQGFSMDHVNLYRLDKMGTDNYLSDLEYYSIYPIKDIFSYWINDKLTFKYVLSAYDEYLPKDYFYSDYDGHLFCVFGKKATNEDTLPDKVLDIIRENGRLIAKPVWGSLSQGVYTLKYKDNSYYINDDIVNEEDLYKKIQDSKCYLYEEFIDNSKDLPTNSVNLRVVIVNPTRNDPHIVVAYHEIENKNYRDQYFDETLSNINLVSGEFEESRRVFFYATENYIFQNPNINQANKDNEVSRIEGKIPHWEMIVKKVTEICVYIGQISYMGMDIIVTENGFKILEINSYPDPIWQIFQPALAPGSWSKDFFEKRLNKLGGK